MSGNLDFSQVPDGTRPIILTPKASSLTGAEREFFRKAKPLGFILFDKDGARNIENPDQIKSLIGQLQDSVGWPCPVLVDQEGGRVQRLSAPEWTIYPPMADFGTAFPDNPDGMSSMLADMLADMSAELKNAGFNVNCAPVLDVPGDGGHDVIGDRAFSSDPEIVGKLGYTACKAFLDNGIIPVIKHIPGHGRAPADSHHDLPYVDASLDTLKTSDFKSFSAVAASDIGPLVWAMTAHVIYLSVDRNRPASISKPVIDDIIRGDIGFSGFLVSDDLAMKALKIAGDIPARAVAALDAGCDAVMYCETSPKIMSALAKAVPPLRDDSLERLQKAVETA